jgi:hypothetical protein
VAMVLLERPRSGSSAFAQEFGGERVPVEQCAALPQHRVYRTSNMGINYIASLRHQTTDFYPRRI